MTNKIRIALAQTNPISVEVDLAESEKDKHVSPFPTLEHNLVDAARAVKDAAERGADVVVFPEYFLQGFVNEGRQVSLPYSCRLIAVPHLPLATPRGLPEAPGQEPPDRHRRLDRPRRPPRDDRGPLPDF